MAAINAKFTGAVVLNPRKPIGLSHKVPIRNAQGNPIPCCYGDCRKDADNRFRVEVPHPTPRWIDVTTGRREMLVYAFCGDAHKAMWLKGSPYENMV